MPVLILALALLLGLGIPEVARAGEIQPDRPEITESARLVPAASFQLETGLVYSKESRAGESAEQRLGSEADLRIGVARNVEVDIQGEPFARVRGPQDATGPGDITLGFRYRFVEGVEEDPWSPSFAVKPFVKLPIAGEPIGSGRADFGLLLLASVALPWDVELEVNAGAAAVGQTRSSGYRGQAIASAALSRDLAPWIFGFVEFFYNSRAQRDERDQFALNTGLVYRLTPTLTIDAAVQTSLLGQGPDYLIRTGLSVRFGP
jgi:Putative MetA-pathway of phenol degradation